MIDLSTYLQADLPDEVYREMVPLDGFEKGTRAGPRLYRWQDRWLVYQTSDWGEGFLLHYGPLSSDVDRILCAYDWLHGNGAGALRNEDWSLLSSALIDSARVASGDVPIPESWPQPNDWSQSHGR